MSDISFNQYLMSLFHQILDKPHCLLYIPLQTLSYRALNMGPSDRQPFNKTTNLYSEIKTIVSTQLNHLLENSLKSEHQDLIENKTTSFHYGLNSSKSTKVHNLNSL